MEANLINGTEASTERCPSPFAVAGLIAVLTSISAIVAAIGAWAVVAIWFADTRGDGLAALGVSFLSIGLFTTIVVNTYMLRWKKLAAIPAALWILAAIWATSTVCRGSYINWQNWRWILQSGDERSYELQWVVRGWTAIAIAAGFGLLAAVSIVKRGKRRDRSLAEVGPFGSN